MTGTPRGPHEHEDPRADPPDRPRLLLIAYACSPYKGSECAVGWHRAIGAAESYETWVICEGSWCGPDIRRYLSTYGPIRGLHFEFVTKGPVLSALGRLPGLYYVAYNIWHRRAIAVAQRLHERRPFSLVHQATFCGYREPGYGWRLGVPFVWGPVGGSQNYPWRFLAEAGPIGACRELLRSLVNSLQLRLSGRVRRAARTAHSLFAANTTIARDLTGVWGHTPPVLLETGVSAISDVPVRTRPHDPFRIFWCGELRAHKALPLLLKAVAALPRDRRFELRIAGSGRERARWQRIAHRYGLGAKVRWLGQLTHADVLRQHHWADVLVFTSLRDTSGNVMLEALASRVPVICPDHQGARDIVTERSGIKIPVTTPKQVVRGIRDAIATLSVDARRWCDLSRGAADRANGYLWTVQNERIQREYARVLAESASPRAIAARPVRRARPDAAAVKPVAKQVGGAIAACLNRSFGGRAGRRFGILVYHRLAKNVYGLPPPTSNVTPERFRRQLTELLDRGFTVARLDDLVSAARRRSAPVPKTFAITFDDAFETVYRFAWPVLVELGLPATVFLSTAFLDRRDPFPFDAWANRYRDVVPGESFMPISSDQCREMVASGQVTLGSHTHTHRDLRGKPGEFRADLSTSLRHLSTRFGSHAWPLAFPFGRADEDLVDVARAAGLSCALTTRPALVEPDTDPFRWGRFNVYQWDTGATLAAKLQGWYTWVVDLETRLTGHPVSSAPAMRAGMHRQRFQRP